MEKYSISIDESFNSKSYTLPSGERIDIITVVAALLEDSDVKAYALASEKAFRPESRQDCIERLYRRCYDEVKKHIKEGDIKAIYPCMLYREFQKKDGFEDFLPRDKLCVKKKYKRYVNIAGRIAVGKRRKIWYRMKVQNVYSRKHVDAFWEAEKLDSVAWVMPDRTAKNGTVGYFMKILAEGGLAESDISENY